jgi:hypothetical protein
VAKPHRANDDHEPHWDQLVEPTTLADGNLRVVLFGHTFETRHGEREDVLLRDGVEVSRVSIFMSGMPFVFGSNFDRIAGDRRKSLTVAYSLGGAKRRS